MTVGATASGPAARFFMKFWCKWNDLQTDSPVAGYLCKEFTVGHSIAVKLAPPVLPCLAVNGNTGATLHFWADRLGEAECDVSLFGQIAWENLLPQKLLLQACILHTWVASSKDPPC